MNLDAVAFMRWLCLALAITWGGLAQLDRNRRIESAIAQGIDPVATRCAFSFIASRCCSTVSEGARHE